MNEVSMGRAEPKKRLMRMDASLLREAEDVLADIRVLWRDLFRNPFADAEESGLTGPQVSVMACVVTRGLVTLTEISRTLGMSHSTASGIVDRLEARGLLSRSTDPADRRRTLITATARVARYVSELQGGPTGRLAAALARATPGQRRSIREGLKTIRELLDRARASAG